MKKTLFVKRHSADNASRPGFIFQCGAARASYLTFASNLFFCTKIDLMNLMDLDTGFVSPWEPWERRQRAHTMDSILGMTLENAAKPPQSLSLQTASDQLET